MALANFIKQPQPPRPTARAGASPTTAGSPSRTSTRFVPLSTAAVAPVASAESELGHPETNGAGHSALAPRTVTARPSLAGLPLIDPSRDGERPEDADDELYTRPDLPAPDASVDEVQAAGRRTLQFLAANGVGIFDPASDEAEEEARLYPKGITASQVEELPFVAAPDAEHPAAPLTAKTATLKQDVGDNIVFLSSEPGTGKHPTLHALLTHMETNQATDLHLQIGEPPTMRIQGVIKRLDMQPLEAEHMKAILYAVCTEDDIERLMEKSKRADKEFYAQSSAVLADHDLTYAYNGTRYRTNVAIENRGTMVVMRRLKSDPPALQDLRLPASVNQIVRASSGLVLITGATSAGKTTTMASIVGKLAREVEANIITVEDPVEYQYSTGLRSIIKQRQVGRDTHSFAAGVKSALRQDPDVIVVGELLDANTAELALAAAQTGHLVFATMHAGSAVEVPARIINFFPADQRAVIAAQLSGVLKLYTYQVLLPLETGGLVPAFAVTPISPALQANIADMQFAEMPRSVEAAARELDGCTLLDSIRSLINHNLVRVSEAASALNKEDRDALRRSMR